MRWFFMLGRVLESGTLRTSGGRVLGVTATGATLEEARSKAYLGVGSIHFEGLFYRRDIGAKGLVCESVSVSL
jgi:phosphoribosylamine-glycine ligase